MLCDPALFCLQGLCINIQALFLFLFFLNAAFFLDEQSPSTTTPPPSIHHALVRLQPFQAHRPVQPNKMGGGLQLPAVHQQQAVDLVFVQAIDERSKNI